MKFLQKRQNEKSFTKFDYVVLSYEQLLQVNGAGGSSSGGGGPSGPSGNLTERGYPSSTDLNTGKSNSNISNNEETAKIYAVDSTGPEDRPDGQVDHFVNDIGNVSDLNLATEGLGGTRKLEYKK